MTGAAQDFAGRAIPDDLSLAEVAEALAKLPRWCGRTRGAVFSVAQHSVLVAGESFRLTGCPRAALYGLLHDAHEMAISDIPNAAKEALDRIAGRAVTRELAEALDAELFPRFGLDYPTPLETLRAVHLADQRVLATELRDLDVQLPYRVPLPAPPLAEPISACWPWPKAEEKFLACWDRFAALADLPFAARHVED